MKFNIAQVNSNYEYFSSFRYSFYVCNKYYHTYEMNTNRLDGGIASVGQGRMFNKVVENVSI